MMKKMKLISGLLAVAMLAVGSAQASTVSSTEFDSLKREVEALRAKLAAGSSAVSSSSAVDRALTTGSLGPNAVVTTKAGKLTIGGLLQVLYVSYANDTQGIFGNPTVGGDVDNNEAQDNDTFGIRRAQLSFTMDIHENIQANVMIDPAAEWAYRVLPTQNQGLIKRLPGSNVAYAVDNGVELAGGNSLAVAQTGGGVANRLLQDAYIRFHGLIPHHEFRIGQFKPVVGWEGPLGNEALDFVERSMIGQLNNVRDAGVDVHGFWWGEDIKDSRFHYWLGAFNGAGNFFGTSGVSYNRADDNDAKDFVATAMLRPLVDEQWGTMELGYSLRIGTHGESGDKSVDGSAPVSGLGNKETWAIKHAAWASYAPGGPVKGWWLRGEYMWAKDRNPAGAVVDLQGNASLAGDNGTATYQAAPNPMNIDGWYFSTGYKLADSVWADGMNGTVMKLVKPLEFTFRYETMANVWVADANHPDGRTDVFKTSVYTGGFNYYIKGNNAKIQFNYNWVNDPDDDTNQAQRGLREVRNNSAVVNFQVAF
jgi:hypothetical protein